MGLIYRWLVYGCIYYGDLSWHLTMSPGPFWDDSRENPTKIDDLGVPLFQETSKWLCLKMGVWNHRESDDQPMNLGMNLGNKFRASNFQTNSSNLGKSFANGMILK
jgi:hypothetical protein